MKNFNFKLTIKSITLILILSGCGSVETATTQKATATETEVFGIQNIQVEHNSTSIIETNSTEIEIVDTPPIQQSEQNHTDTITQPTLITQPIDITSNTTPVEEIEEVVTPIEETKLNYTERFINQESCNQILDKEFLTICYDYNLKVAKSVAYTLYGDLVNELNIQERPSFYVEREIESEYRAETTDYTNTGYDRGHLAPDASFDWSQESLDSTYSLANIIPQVPVVNRQMWLKVENYARDKAVELFELNIVNVVRYSNTPQRIGENNISVSIGYYKILFNSEKEYEECFYYANDVNASSENDQLENHLVDCTELSNQ
jgi:endonuclease G